jgi:DNA (cytosine-5)-methyltransferase 1
LNRPKWNVIEGSVTEFSGRKYCGIDLLAGGVPCPPFSIAGKQLGAQDERDLFPEFLRLVKEIKPRAILIENVRGLLSEKFNDYRKDFLLKLKKLGYIAEWKLLNAADFGVPQLRPRAILVGFKDNLWQHFEWPVAIKSSKRVSVGDVLYPLMKSNGWKSAKEWAKNADKIAPTIVGGSKKHGGPDLGPTRARKAWLELGVNGGSIAESAPDEDFQGLPRLTVDMAAAIQGFPKSWKFSGKKTAAYRQVGNAFPPPVAFHLGMAIKSVLNGDNSNIDNKYRYESQLNLLKSIA